MGAVSDAMGGPIYGFGLATGFAALLFLALVLNNVFKPAAAVFQRADQSDYSPNLGAGYNRAPLSNEAENARSQTAPTMERR